MFTLKARDFFKGLILAVLTPILTIIVNSTAAGTLELNWKQIGVTAVGTMAAYLLKNLFTDDVKQAQKIVDANATQKAAAPNDSELNPKP